MRAAVVAFACAVLAMASPGPALAAKGQLVAVAGGKLVAVNPDGTGLRTLYSPPGGAITGLAFSPDGNRLAFSYSGRLVLFDVNTKAAQYATTPGANEQDVDPAWVNTANGLRIAFRRVSTLGQQHLRIVPAEPYPIVTTPVLSPLTDTIAFAPDAATLASTLLGVLSVSVNPLEIDTGVTGTPAWSTDTAKLAYVQAGTLRVASGPWTRQTTRIDVTSTPAAAPRFSPEGNELVFLADGQVRTVPVAERATSTPVPGLVGVTAVDWQPCVATTVSCYSSVPPTCTTSVAQVSTQADQPVQLPAAPCTDPSSLPLSFVLVKGPDNGTLAGATYTPNPYFAGQDTVTYKVSNGYSESEVIKVTIFVVPRPAPGAGPPSATPNPSVPAAPFLALSVKPRLDRKRTTTARLTCDQPCAFTVRLEGSVRVKKKAKTLKGPALRRSLTPGRVLALKLKLPRKPAGKVRTVWITGTVRGATGVARAVRLPVTVR